MDVVRKLKWTSTALRQRNRVFDYWNKRNKNKESTALLKSYPELGMETSSSKTRVLYMSYYSILYQFTKQQIIITGFWDNRQEPSKLLHFLKNN